MSEIKRSLYDLCLSQVQERITRLQTEMKALKVSAETDTKSSMGDKYETAREMINLEKGKIDQQLAEALKAKQVLDSIDSEKSNWTCVLGSLVGTPNANYFLSISIGKVSLDDTDYFIISPMSPIGQQLLDKKAGDQFSFGGKPVEILSVT